MIKLRHAARSALVGLLCMVLGLAGVNAQGREGASRPHALFTTYEVTDPQFGGMRVASLAIPAGWRATSQVSWDFTSANYPVQYLRGTTRMNDPHWGTSERDSNFSYHWTDSQGNYRASNDPSFNPNAGAGGGPNWQRMEPAR